MAFVDLDNDADCDLFFANGHLQGCSQLQEIHGGRVYQSHFGSRLHFGLGDQARLSRIEVRWLGGGVQTMEDVAVDQRIQLLEGADRPVSQ